MIDVGPNFLSWLQGEGLCADPTSCLVSAAFDVLWQALGLPNPLQIFEQIFNSLFGGRAKLGPDSATDNVALTLLSSRNPMVRQWGKGVRILERRGIPISVSDVSVWQRTYGRLQNAVMRDLQAQMPQVTANGERAGLRTYKAYQSLAYSRRCNASTRDPECARIAYQIDQLWYFPLVLGSTSPNQKARCACLPPRS